MNADLATMSKLVEMEVHSQLDNKFTNEFDRRADKLISSFKEDVERFRSTLKWLGVTLLGILGIGAFTIADFLGIPTKIEKAVADQIHAAASKSEVQTQYVARLRSMLAESLMLSIEIGSIRSNASGSPDDSNNDSEIGDENRKLKKEDAIFLTTYLLFDNPDEALATRIVNAFRHANSSGQLVYKQKVLDALRGSQSGTPKEREDYARLKKDSGFAIALIDGLKYLGAESNTDVSDALRHWLADRRLPGKVRLAILEQLADRRDFSALEHFVAAAKDAQKQYREAGLRGVVAVDPGHEIVQNAIASLKSEGALITSAPLMARLATELCTLSDEDESQDQTARTQKLRVIMSPLREIAFFFAERTMGWYWPAEILRPDGATNPSPPFDLDKSPLYLRLKEPIRTSRGFSVIRTKPVLHRDCVSGALRLLEIALSIDKSEYVIRYVGVLTVYERRYAAAGTSNPRSRAPVFSALVVPGMLLAEDVKLKCREGMELSVPKGARVGLTVEQQGGKDTIVALVHPERAPQDRLRCAAESLSPLKGQAELTQLGKT